jgi:hypothetical protein
LQAFDDLVDGWFAHGSRPDMTAMDPREMPPQLAALKADEATILGHRLLKSFHKLRVTRHREQLIALAESLLREEEKSPAKPGA